MDESILNNMESLLQKYLEGDLEAEEAEALLENLQRFGGETPVREAFRSALWTHFLLSQHFQAEQKKFSFDFDDELNEQTDFEAQTDPTNALLTSDLDALARLIAQSPSLAKKDETKEKTPTRKIRPYDPDAPRSFIPPGILASILLGVLVVSVFFEWRKPTAENPSDAVVRKSSIAVVSSADEVRWTTGDTPPKFGEPLAAGALRFESGTIELLFFNGIRAVVEGPADLVLLNEKRVFCDRGNWSATVPPQGVGFEIQTPGLTIRDLGTRFYAAVDGERSDVHVLQGAVEVEKSPKEKTVLKTGEGIDVRRNEPIRRVAAAFDRFVTALEMRRRSDAFLFRSGVEKITEGIPGPILSVDFKEKSPSDASLFGGERIEGRAPDTKAFRLTKAGDRIRLRNVGSVDALTVVGWFRVDSLDDEMNPILMTEGSKRNGIVWRLSRQGCFVVGLRQKTSHDSGTFMTPSVMTPDRLGTWMQFALSLDGARQQLAVYVDGNLVFSEKLLRPCSLDLSDLDVGSWKSTSNDRWSWRLDGAVGDFQVYDRVLSMEEIRALAFETKQSEPRP